ncbi:MAG: CoA transferase [Hyphomicrobiaceae bacterium]|nr:MAG: CoA transferase [Hyphomicrobiaceae bacterium]
MTGLKVVDLTRVLGGPYATQILADHGADVIKLEPPQGDEVRDWGPPFHDGDASYFIGINRNKRSVGLDLSLGQGRDLLLTLLEGADVLIENFKPGAMESWGLGYEGVLKERFPRLVYAKISGFGPDGPYGGFPGYDGIVGAMAGHFSINGAPVSGPTRIGLPIVDIGTGLFATIGILMALYERASSGEGQYIDMTLFDCALAVMHPHFANYFLSGKVPGLTGNPHPNIVPYDKFKTKTCEVFIGAGNDRAFKRVCEEMGAPELAFDPRFKSNGERMQNRAALTQAMTQCLSKVDGEAFSLRLLKAGLPCGPILNARQALEQPHTRHRAMIAESGWYKGIATPIKLGRTPAKAPSPPPRFSEHTRAVLAEHGFDEKAIERLLAAGVVVEKRKR